MTSAELTSPPVTVITIPVEPSTTTGPVPAVTSTVPGVPTTNLTETTVAATIPPTSGLEPEVLGIAGAVAFALALLMLVVRARRRPKPPPTPTLTERVRELSRRAEEGATAGNEHGR
jgi:hypothetical protein